MSTSVNERGMRGLSEGVYKTYGYIENRQQLRFAAGYINDRDIRDSYQTSANILLAIIDKDNGSWLFHGRQREQLGALVGVYINRLDEPKNGLTVSDHSQKLGWELGKAVSKASPELRTIIFNNLFSENTIKPMFLIDEPDRPSRFIKAFISASPADVSSHLYGDKANTELWGFRNTPNGIAIAGLIGTQQAADFLIANVLHMHGAYYDFNSEFTGDVDNSSHEQLEPWLMSGHKHARALIFAVNHFKNNNLDFAQLQKSFTSGYVGMNLMYFMGRGLILEQPSFGRDFLLYPLMEGIKNVDTEVFRGLRAEIDMVLSEPV